VNEIHINQKVYRPTEKATIATRMFDGVLYALCDKNEERELWLKVVPFSEDRCIRCGYTGVAIDRHHVNGRKKSNKTVLLCANCHREVHAGGQL
jgi:hypothetical protein